MLRALGFTALLTIVTDASALDSMSLGADGTVLPTDASVAAANAAAAKSAGSKGRKPILAPGSSLEFPGHTSPRSFGLVPSQKAFAVADGGAWGNLNKDKWWPFSWWSGRAPYPCAYIVRGNGDLLKMLEFTDRRALPLGMAESGASAATNGGSAEPRHQGRLAISFPVVNGVEVWYSTQFDASQQQVIPNDQVSHDNYINFKLTVHEASIKPALPVFDSAGRTWMPFTIADRLSEEGDRVIVLWAYMPDTANRWEVFTRRQFNVEKDDSYHIHSVHLDSEGRIYTSGLTKWVFEDGTYGQELKKSLDSNGSYNKLDVFRLTNDRASEAYRREQLGRWKEGNAGEPPSDSVWEGIHVNYALERTHRYSIPFAFPCVWPLMVLTGDGHAITACFESDTLIVMKIGDVVPLGEGVERPSSYAHATELGIAEPWMPPLPEGHTTVLRASEEHSVLATIKAPYGVSVIGALQMDPSGRAFYMLDKARKRILSCAWPLPADVSGIAGAAGTGSAGGGKLIKALVPSLPA